MEQTRNAERLFNALKVDKSQLNENLINQLISENCVSSSPFSWRCKLGVWRESPFLIAVIFGHVKVVKVLCPLIQREFMKENPENGLPLYHEFLTSVLVDYFSSSTIYIEPDIVEHLLIEGANVFLTHQSLMIKISRLKKEPDDEKNKALILRYLKVLKLFLEQGAALGNPYLELNNIINACPTLVPLDYFGEVYVIGSGLTRETPGFESAICSRHDFIKFLQQERKKIRSENESSEINSFESKLKALNNQCERRLQACFSSLGTDAEEEIKQLMRLIDLNLPRSLSRLVTRFAALERIVKNQASDNVKALIELEEQALDSAKALAQIRELIELVEKDPIYGFYLPHPINSGVVIGLFTLVVGCLSLLFGKVIKEHEKTIGNVMVCILSLLMLWAMYRRITDDPTKYPVQQAVESLVKNKHPLGEKLAAVFKQHRGMSAYNEIKDECETYLKINSHQENVLNRKFI